MDDLAEVIRTERVAFVGFLETLTEAEWATASLCEGWSVQDVAAHLAFAPTLGLGQSIVGLGRAGLRINRFIADSARRAARQGPSAIIRQLRANAATGARPLGMPQPAVLADAVVHPLDARRPLDSHRHVPDEAFGPVAELLAHTRWPSSLVLGGSGHHRIRGLRLVADDQSWTHGHGPEVHGSGEAILLALAGRPVGPGELRGEGATTLLSRA
jgi:uncharacterized protein (TIGR03083 family)